jgi:hypothetical protein
MIMLIAMPTTRRGFLGWSCGGVLLGRLTAQPSSLTVAQVIERIKQNVGVPWRAQTGIATTMVATVALAVC